MSETLKPGDTVRLKSGGPLMTIEDIDDYGMVSPLKKATCTWFDGRKKNSDLIAVASLIPDEDE